MIILDTKTESDINVVGSGGAPGSNAVANVSGRSNSVNDDEDESESSSDTDDISSISLEGGINDNARLSRVGRQRRRTAATNLISGSLSHMMQNTVNVDLFFVVNNFGGDLPNLTCLRPYTDVANTLYSKLQLVVYYCILVI